MDTSAGCSAAHGIDDTAGVVRASCCPATESGRVRAARFDEGAVDAAPGDVRDELAAARRYYRYE